MVKKPTKNPLMTGKENLNPFLSLHHDINSLFDDIFFDNFSRRSPSHMTISAPKMDALENDKEYKISFELPGIEEKDIELSINNGVLTIKGEMSDKKENKEENYYICERHYGSFERSINLSKNIVAEKAEANFKNGVLTITIPKEKSQKAHIKLRLNKDKINKGEI